MEAPLRGSLYVAGAYNPSHTMKWFHIDPDEAVCIHQDINSARSLAIHWGTFREGEMNRRLKNIESSFGSIQFLVQCSCSGWPTGNGKKLSNSQ